MRPRPTMLTDETIDTIDAPYRETVDNGPWLCDSDRAFLRFLRRATVGQLRYHYACQRSAAWKRVAIAREIRRRDPK